MQKVELPFLEKLRYLYHLEVELDTCLNMVEKTTSKHLHVCLKKAVALVKTEIELLRFSVEHPEYCAVHPATEENNGIPVISLHWKSSLVNLMELHRHSLYYLGVITDGNGNQRHSLPWW